MKVNTRLFGEIDIADDKIVTLEKGIIGFPDLQKFTLIYDLDKGDKALIKWFQSLDEPQFALPVIDPSVILPDYAPSINDELLEPLGELNDDNLLILVTIKVPGDVKQMTVNLRAPLIINADTLKGGQLITEDDNDVRFPIYDLLQKSKEGGE